MRFTTYYAKNSIEQKTHEYFTDQIFKKVIPTCNLFKKSYVYIEVTV